MVDDSETPKHSRHSVAVRNAGVLAMMGRAENMLMAPSA
jgi:hypothetical protein